MPLGVASLVLVTVLVLDRVGMLVAHLASADDARCSAAARELGELGADAAPAVTALLDRVKIDPMSQGCSDRAESALLRLGATAVPALIDALDNPERAHAAHVVLAQMPAVSVTPLVEKVRAGGPGLDVAVVTLSGMRAKAAPAIPALRDAWRAGRIAEFRFIATLTWIGTPETLPDLAEAVNSPDSRVRDAAVRAIPDVAPQSERATTALTAALRDSEVTIRARACEGLGRMSQQARQAVPALVAALDDPEPSVRFAAAGALGGFGPSAHAAIPALQAAAREGRVPDFLVAQTIASIRAAE
jgi:HEAT repeat protein